MGRGAEDARDDLSRAQFAYEEEHGTRVTHPREAKRACQRYIQKHCGFRFQLARDGADARALEDRLRREHRPTLNPLA